MTGAVALIDMLRREVKLGEHPDLGKATLAIAHLRSFPDSTHTIQDRVEMTVDRRLLPGDDPDDVVTEIARIARRLETMQDPASGLSWTVEVKHGPFMYPSLSDPDGPAIRLITEAAKAAAGLEPERFYSPSAFDQGYLNHVGIATANFGAGEHQYAHTDYDTASVERTTDSARVYAFMMLDYLS